MNNEPDLFAVSQPEQEPLAARLRPQTLDEVVGQGHLLGPGKPLRHAIESGSVHSFVLWGPPGVGKTTLARLVSIYSDALFLQLSAVFSGVKDIRAAIDQAKDARARQRKAVLFVDEVHRFNKSQQDAFLPYIEDGTICFIGATTENPSFEVNNALLSRLRVYRLQSIELLALTALLERASGFYPRLHVTESFLSGVASLADGDARQSLNLFELAVEMVAAQGERAVLDDSLLSRLAATSAQRFDKRGEAFYDFISALHKSIRGSDPDAALYWLARMLEGGCDPIYIARRAIRIASEDIGLADPRALQLALDATAVQERLGSPEGELALAQLVVYLACAAKSNAVYSAFTSATKLARESGSLDVPLHLRNAPTRLMEESGYGAGYRYAHDEAGAFAAGERYFPPEIPPVTLYHPTDRGLEQQIAEKLRRLRAFNAEAEKKGSQR
ncbi:MAG: replication-associated recombination protein A [Luminiphilus sp.]|jgi:putative ATPase|nr:replication-associated recombination protein A [Luminiphilus sp.]